MQNPADAQGTSSVSSEPRAARLAALRDELDHRIDEIVTARADRVATLKKEFDAAWKEFKSETGEPH